MNLNSYSTRTERARAILRGAPRWIVAVSGGVDSASLLQLAAETLGAPAVVAATGISEAVPSHDVEDARAVARQVGVEHRLVRTRELARPGYRANAGDRCYHCRRELFELLRGLAEACGAAGAAGTGVRLAYGAIVDDLGDDRPGMVAAGQLGVAAPLLDAGWSKADVRRFAAERDLLVRDRPASPCLASRIPVGTEVTPGRLAAVDRAEAGLRALGFLRFRVRHHGPLARVELDASEQPRLADPALRGRFAAAVREGGFRDVELRELQRREPILDGGQ